MKQYIIAVFALMALLLVSGAFATVETAAAAQATQLQLHIDRAITMGNVVVTKVAAANKSTTELNSILSNLTVLRNSIDVNATNISVVQGQRKQAMALVTAFKKAVGSLFSENDKKDIREKAEKEFKEKHAKKIKEEADGRKQFNLKQFEKYAEKQQRYALNLSDDDNVSLTSQLNDKLAEIRARIEANKITMQEIAQIRTKIKAESESLKSNRTEVVTEIRLAQLKARVLMIDNMIDRAIAANMSTTELLNVSDRMSALIDAYAAGNITGREFEAAAQRAIVASTKVIQSQRFVRIRDQLRDEYKDDKVELRNQTKMDLKMWKENRESMRESLKNMREEFKRNLSSERKQARENKNNSGLDMSDDDNLESSDSEDDSSNSGSNSGTEDDRLYVSDGEW